jgi:hypothetical protein
LQRTRGRLAGFVIRDEPPTLSALHIAEFGPPADEKQRHLIRANYIVSDVSDPSPAPVISSREP